MFADDEDEEDFASLLEASFQPETYEQGQLVEGEIVSIGKEVAFVDVGGKGEATIDVAELIGEDGEPEARVGDIVHGVVVSTRGGLKLSHRLARGAVTRQRLEEAWRAGLPVEGRVERAIKGGFEVRIGGQRAFCPISQIDTGFTQDASVFEGEVHTFRIIEFRHDGKDLVVSRRVLLEEEEAERAEEVRLSIVPGAELTGRVASVRPYGAFVDLGGGIQGLLHVSEMGWSRISDPSAVAAPGDEITVKVLAVDHEQGKISLGLKQLLADPWDGVADTYEPGQLLRAKITRVAEFGAFVELEPGIEALAHASTFAGQGTSREAWKKGLTAGAEVAVEILNVDLEARRIGVKLIDAEETTEAKAYARRRAERDAGGKGDGFGASLGDKLRDALRPKDD